MPSMDPFLANEVQHLTRKYAQTVDDHAWKIPIRRDLFEGLLSYLADNGHLDSTDVRMVATLTLLGPATTEAAPEVLRNWLLARIETNPPDTPHPADRVVDHVIVLGTARGEGSWNQPVGGGPWGQGTIWANARQCLVTKLAGAVHKVDNLLHGYFPKVPRQKSKTALISGWFPLCYGVNAPELLADRLMGFKRELDLSTGKQVEITGQSGQSLFDLAYRIAAFPSGQPISFKSRARAVYKSGASRIFQANDSIAVTVLSKRPRGLRVNDPELKLWPQERVRFSEPCSLTVPQWAGPVEIAKDAAVEVRPAGTSVEVWRLERQLPLAPVVRRVFEVASGNCELYDDNGLICAVNTGGKFVVLGQDVGFELAINQKKVRSPGDGGKVIVTGSCKLNETPCSCGWKQCKNRHHISVWAPYQRPNAYVTLQNMLFSVVKGPFVENPQVRVEHPLPAKAFEKSMYYPLIASLTDAVRFRMAPVEWKVCGNCGDAFVFGPACKKEDAFDPDTMRRDIEDWIIPEGDNPAQFVVEGRVHCNFATRVWAPRPLHKLSLADMVRKGFLRYPVCKHCGASLRDNLARSIQGANGKKTEFITLCDKCNKPADIAREEFVKDPICTHCGVSLTVDGIREWRTVDGGQVEFLVGCRLCGTALRESLSQKIYRCDNFYTISNRQFEKHLKCGGEKEHVLFRADYAAAALPPGADLSRTDDRLALARIYNSRRHLTTRCPEPNCDALVMRLPWCPCCNALGLKLDHPLPKRVYQVWVPTNILAVQLGGAVAKAQPPGQSPVADDNSDA